MDNLHGCFFHLVFFWGGREADSDGRTFQSSQLKYLVTSVEQVRFFSMMPKVAEPIISLFCFNVVPRLIQYEGKMK